MVVQAVARPASRCGAVQRVVRSAGGCPLRGVYSRGLCSGKACSGGVPVPEGWVREGVCGLSLIHI
eukprot:669820-Prymnesium_polylepis.1